MATVIPFHGIRYNTGRISDMAAVVTPPYDVIDAAAQQKYYERHPYNVIRLEYGLQYPGDDDGNNRYTRAARDYREWLDSGILIREPDAAIYLQEQEFRAGGKLYRRTGFFARVALEEYATGIIRPHEETLSKPKADRLALLSACRANFSPVFSLYNDRNNDGEHVKDREQPLAAELNRVKQSPPDLDLVDDEGVRNRLWVITDPHIHHQVAAILRDRPLYIADGHHRYETALDYYGSVKDRCPDAAYVLMYLVSTADPGLVILPTHRVLHSLPSFDPHRLAHQLEQDFTVERLSVTEPDQVLELLDTPDRKDGTTLLMITPEPAVYRLTLNNQAGIRSIVPQKSEAWRRLDVAVLHVLILQQLLGLEPESLARQENLAYTRDAVEAVQAVWGGGRQLAFILNPTRIEQVTAVAAAGDKMPQKSTYFYPKILTGMVINDLAPERRDVRG